MSLRLGNSIEPSVLTYADFLKEKSRFPDIEMPDFERQKKRRVDAKIIPHQMLFLPTQSR